MAFDESNHYDDEIAKSSELSKSMMTAIIFIICMPLVAVLVWVNGLNKKVSQKRKEM